MTPSQTILVTGATGYIGGRLLPRLIDQGHNVRVLVRSEARALSRPWAREVAIVAGDARDPRALSEALRGVDTAYYLIHSMTGGSDFHALDIEAARAFGKAARDACVGHIIYVGGLGDPDANLSPHLRSRQECGQVLRSTGLPVTEFRAAVIVGSGSISFEMVRYLVERLPVMVCPRWIYSRVQPMAIDDLLDYLVAALSNPDSRGLTIEVGGEDVTTYGGMMLGYAKARGLRRMLIPVPVLTPRLSSYWVHWVTPIPAPVTVALVEGLRNDIVVSNDLARRLFPDIQPMDYASAIARVTEELDSGRIDTSWSDAYGASGNAQEPVTLESRHGLILERRRLSVSATPREVYSVFAGIGARRGWYFANWAWRIRGMVDRLLGGAGLRRGRRHPDDLRVGDAVDFWRVETLEPDRLLRLKAEMKLPGNAWLQFEARGDGAGATWLEQTSAYEPRGLGGLAYWYGLYPIHAWIFRGLIRSVARRAERVRGDMA